MYEWYLKLQYSDSGLDRKQSEAVETTFLINQSIVSPSCSRELSGRESQHQVSEPEAKFIVVLIGLITLRGRQPLTGNHCSIVGLILVSLFVIKLFSSFPTPRCGKYFTLRLPVVDVHIDFNSPKDTAAQTMFCIASSFALHESGICFRPISLMHPSLQFLCCG